MRIKNFAYRNLKKNIINQILNIMFTNLINLESKFVLLKLEHKFLESYFRFLSKKH